MKTYGRKVSKVGRKTSAPMASKKPSTSVSGTNGASLSASPSFEEIARRSYELYLARGGQPSSPGQELEDWLKAESELRGDPKNQPS